MRSFALSVEQLPRFQLEQIRKRVQYTKVPTWFMTLIDPKAGWNMTKLIYNVWQDPRTIAA